MQYHTKKLIPIFFIFAFIISSIFVLPSKGISYYNHLLNPSFSLYENFIEDGSFESGAINKGIEYGNWSGTATYNQTIIHSGLYSRKIYDTSQTAWYNFTSTYYTYGADVKNFTFYARSDSGTTGRIIVYYTDLTTTQIDFTPDTVSYQIVKVLSLGSLMGGKIIKAFRITNLGAVCSIFVDDVRFEVETGENSQDEITSTSSPWRRNNILELDKPAQLSTVSGHYDNTSLVLPLGSQDVCLQAINYLDSDYIETIDLYAVKLILPYQISIKIMLGYSDGTFSEKTMTKNTTDWEYFNFGHTWVKQNKYVISFSIWLGVGNLASVGIDDVGLWATLPLSYKRYLFSISPSPIEVTTSGFTVYQKQAYTLNNYLYNENGSLTESGTYTINDNTGTHTGSFTNGIFSYSLTARTASEDFYETITIIIIVGDKTETFTLLALWKYVSTYIPTGNTEATTYILFVFIWLFVPSLILASITYRAGIPVLGFISGLAIMSGIGYSAGVIPLWLLFVNVLCVILLLFGMFKRGDVM